MTLKEKYRRLSDFIKGTADEHIAAFAAQTAFFIFLSFFPLVSLLMSMSKLLPITQNQLIELICNVIPGRFEDYVTSIVKDIYSGGTYTMTVVSALLALWSAAKGLMAIRNGLNEVYRSRERRNYLIIRGISSAYTALFLVMLLVMIPINMFGTQIVLFIINKFPNLDNIAMFIYGLRTAATFVVLFLFFWLLYTIVPNRKLKFIRQIPGAAFTAGAWVVITKIISIFIDQFLSNSYMYGSLTMVILMMMWLYAVSNMIFVGAQINEYLYMVKYKEVDDEIERRKAEAKAKKLEERAKKLRFNLNAKGTENGQDVNDSQKTSDGHVINDSQNTSDGHIMNDSQNNSDNDVINNSQEKPDTLNTEPESANDLKNSRVVDFNIFNRKKEKHKLKKVSDEDGFVDDEITGV